MVFGDRLDDRWRFRIDDSERTIAVSGKRRSNDGETIRRWAEAGHGIALKSIWDVRTQLAEGTLVELLRGFSVEDSSLQLVYPAGRPLPRRARSFIDHALGNLSPPLN